MKDFLSLFLIGCMALASSATYAAPRMPLSQWPNHGSELTSDIIIKGHNLVAGKCAVPEMSVPSMAEITSSPADVITQVQGQKHTYTKACTGYVSMIAYISYYEEEGIYADIVMADNGEVYFHNFISGAAQDTYIMGLLKDNEITVDLPQTINWFDAYQLGASLVALKYETDETGWSTYVYDPTIDSITFSVAANGTIQMNSLGDDYAVGIIWEDDLSWTGYADLTQVYTPTEFNIAEIPQGAKIEHYVNFQDESGYIVEVATEGEEFYLRGLCQSMPKGTIKGRVEGDKIYFEQNQIAGIYTEVFPVYLKWMSFDENIGDYVLGPDDEPYVMVIDQETGNLKASDSDKILIFNFYTDALRELISFPDLELHYQISAAGTPANPNELEYHDRYFNYYGYYSFRFNIPVLTDNQVILDTSCLYYRIFIDGDLFELTDEDYSLGDYKSLTNIPFDFNNNNNISALDATTREISIYLDGVTTAGVQSIYKYNGVTTVSDVVTLNVRNGNVSITSGINTISDNQNEVIKREYFDLNGISIVPPVKGIYLECQTLENGEIKTVKKISR